MVRVIGGLTNHSQKKGREPNAPLVEGTAKRLSEEARQAAPDWARIGGWAFGCEKFAVFRRGRSRSYAKFAILNSFYVIAFSSFILRLDMVAGSRPASEPFPGSPISLSGRRSQFA